jgi:hypothetical protein
LEQRGYEALEWFSAARAVINYLTPGHLLHPMGDGGH